MEEKKAEFTPRNPQQYITSLLSLTVGKLAMRTPTDAGNTPKNVFKLVVQEDVKVNGYLMLFANVCTKAGLDKANVNVLTTVKTFIDLAIGILILLEVCIYISLLLY